MKKLLFKRVASLFICIAILSLCTVGCSENRYSDDVAQDLNFQHAAQDREVGITQSLIVYKDNYAYGIHYPSIGIDAIDAAIKNTVNGLADSFTAALKDYKVHKDEDLAILTADYKTYLISDNDDHKFVSLVFEMKTSVPKQNIHKENIHTMFFDLDEERELSFSDVFKSGAEKEVSNQITGYFKTNRLYSSKTNSDVFKANTSANASNFQKFAFNGKNAMFYFDAGRLFDQSEGCVEAHIHIEKLKAFVDENIFNAVLTAENVFNQEAQSDYPEAPQTDTPASVPSASKYIAFTFDDGPHPEVTTRILDVLEKTNNHATFFVLGTRAGSYADIIKRAYKLGCEIGNHSYSHARLRNLSAADKMSEINKTNKLIKEITGEAPSLFRVPYGDFKGIEKDIGMPLIQWSIDTKDWKYKDCTGAQREKIKQSIISSVLNNASGGEIVLMHDLYDLTAEVFEELVPQLTKQGFMLVTVSELYELYGIELEPSLVYRTPKRDRQLQK